MLAIAFTGVIQHEVEQAQLRRLTASIREEAGTGCVIACNAAGLFANAARLEAQIEMLFDSGIDVVFSGEQAIGRNAGRTVLAKAAWPVVRPINLAETAPGTGALLLNVEGGRIWMVSAADGTGKIPVSLPHVLLEKFFRNKPDKLPVVLNVDGTDVEYRRALMWRLAGYGGNVLFFGSGSGFMADLSGRNSCERFIQNDIGVIENEGSIGGMTPEIWWQRHIDRFPAPVSPGWGLLRCDYTIVWLDENGKPHKHMQKTMRI